MAKTIVGLFDDPGHAQRVVQELTNAGFPREDISLVANNVAGEDKHDAGETTDDVTTGAMTGAGAGAMLGGLAGLLVGAGALAIPGIGPIVAAGPLAAALAGAGIGAAAGGLIGALVGWGIPEEEAGYYAEGVRRGGTLVGVKAEDNRVNQAVTILEHNGAVNVDERAAEWRAGGWAGYDANAKPYDRDAIMKERETRIPIVQEELEVGKHEVARGSVRVHTTVEEQPVGTDVRLREENVHVERRPVDRPATEADLNAAAKGSIEMTERAEVPMVDKQARVVEEVVVGKDVSERTETVRDTVRKTDVAIDEIDTSAPGRKSTVGRSK